MSIRSSRSSVLVVALLAFASGCGGGYYASKAPPTGAYPGGGPHASAPLAQRAATAAEAAVAAPAPEPVGTEEAKDYGVNPFVDAAKDRLSTFSIDVDTASYSFARKKLLRENVLPAYASVRAEEFLNSFEYGYPVPDAQSRTPFRVDFAASPSPLTAGHHLVRVGVQAKRVTAEERQPVHLVYLVDTSGSMGGEDRLPLAKRSLALLTETLKPGDTVALCTYAGDTRVVLQPTGIEEKAKILTGIKDLHSAGGTAMASGIQIAYDLASKTLVKGHLNRIVVLSDGDANIGNSTHDKLLQTIAQYKAKGITLSTVGFGSGNYKDTMMEQLADKGDGNYTYIDGEDEARKVFSQQVDGLLQVVARDVKIQVEIDPSVIRRYRLIGYENRDIADKDFRNDKVDAGEVGAGHSVTALYDVELVDPKVAIAASAITVRMRHKPAKNTLHGGSDTATESTFAMPAAAYATSFEGSPDSYRLAVAASAFAEVLRHSPHAAEWKLEDIERIAAGVAQGRRDRVELVGLIQKAGKLTGSKTVAIAR